jgi:hypothetical protein
MDKGTGEFQAMWDGNKLGVFASYKDTGADENKQLLEWAFGFIKSIPPQVARVGQAYDNIGSNPYAVCGGVLGSSPAAVPALAIASQSPVQVETYKSQRRNGTVYCFIDSDCNEIATQLGDWQQVATTHNGEANYYYANTERSIWTWRMESVQEPKGKGTW